MKKLQADVRDFMVRAGQVCPDKPTLPSMDVRMLRVKLIAEELLELCESFGLGLRIWPGGISVYPKEHHCLTEAADGIIDLMVVTVGAGVACGLNLEPLWDEVHRSNMSKFIDGHRRDDGKWVKGPSYSPANLKPIIDGQQG